MHKPRFLQLNEVYAGTNVKEPKLLNPDAFAEVKQHELGVSIRFIGETVGRTFAIDFQWLCIQLGIVRDQTTSGNIILSFLQHNDVTLHGPFNTIEDLRIFAVARFGEIAADIQIDKPVHHSVGNYWLKASIPC